MYRRSEKRKGGSFFNVPGSGPDEVSRLSWLSKLPRERWSAGGQGGDRARGAREERDMAANVML